MIRVHKANSQILEEISKKHPCFVNGNQNVVAQFIKGRDDELGVRLIHRLVNLPSNLDGKDDIVCAEVFQPFTGWNHVYIFWGNLEETLEHLRTIPNEEKL